MRNFILSVFLMLGLNPMSGQESKTEICVEFRVGNGVIDAAYSNNGAHLSEIISYLEKVENDNTLQLTGVSFCGSASPEGPFQLNRQLASQRLASLEGYVRKRISIPDSLISRCNTSIGWERLASLVEHSDMAHKDEALRVLRDVPEYTYRGRKLVDSRKRQLMRLQYGRTWFFMQDHFFEQVRNACAVVVTVRHKPAVKPAEPVVVPPVDTVVAVQPVVDTLPAAKERSPFYMALKTNMLYDVLATPNIGIEFYIGNNFSVAANWMYAWWKNDNRHRYWRIYGGDIAIRKWFGAKADAKPLTGHHLGIYGQMVTYDFEFGNRGYLADRWSYAGGVEYGYALPIARRLNIDFTIGIGYLGGKYKEYLPIDDHYVWQETKQRHWFGPTKVEVSLVWLLGYGNNNEKKGGTR